MSEQHPTVPYGYCHCGCGGKTPIADRSKASRGHIKGEPIRFISGHQNRQPKSERAQAIAELRKRWDGTGIEYGYCLCGCGERSRIASRTNGTLGHVAGEPYPRLVGHKKPERRISIEDRGFESPCWIWQMTRGWNGYGYITKKPKRLLAHRVFYEEAKGSIPKGLVLHHRCEQRLCVNPDHLQPLNHGEHAWLHYRQNQGLTVPDA